MSDDELHFASLVSLAERVRTREVSSLEIVEACLRRIDAVNPRLNAVVRLAGDATRAARQADAELRDGIVRGPLHGLPFTIKDSLDTAGLVTTAGTMGWRERVPSRDATVVARLRAAGAILLGKTNTPEFTWSDATDNDVYGRTNNPYDLTRTPGGSSGGAAAIVAAGGSPLDIGSDSGDSIRHPAHVCGVAGIKPTQGRVPRTGHTPSYRGIVGSWTQLGPIARAVDDLALVLPIIAGPDGEDPHVAPVALREPRDVSIPGLSVVFFTDNSVHTPTPETIETVRAAARVLADAGARVDERLPPGLAEAAELWTRIVRADGFAWLRRLLQEAGTEGEGTYSSWLPDEKPVPAAELTAMLDRVDDVRAGLLRFMRDVDLIVCPVMPQPAVPHAGTRSDLDVTDTYSETHNITGWPAVVVRAGTSPEGLPIGVQLVAQPWREDVALAAAKSIETALGGWQRPPI